MYLVATDDSLNSQMIIDQFVIDISCSKTAAAAWRCDQATSWILCSRNVMFCWWRKWGRCRVWIVSEIRIPWLKVREFTRWNLQFEHFIYRMNSCWITKPWIIHFFDICRAWAIKERFSGCWIVRFHSWCCNKITGNLQVEQALFIVVIWHISNTKMRQITLESTILFISLSSRPR